MTESEAIEEVHRIKPYVEIVPQRAEALDIAIKALEEIQQFRAIGTVEECQAAVEKQKPQKAVLATRGDGFIKFYPCPCCSTSQKYIPVYPKQNYCVNCGQKLNWE